MVLSYSGFLVLSAVLCRLRHFFQIAAEHHDLERMVTEAPEGPQNGCLGHKTQNVNGS